jgi:putative membrane protein
MVAGSIVATMPSIGPSEAAFIVRKIIGKISTEMYLVVLGGINTVNIMFSFFVLYLIGKTRSGVAAAVNQLVSVDQNFLLLSIGVVILSLGFGALATDVISKKAVCWLQNVNYRRVTFATIAVITVLCFFLSGLIGLLIFGIAAAVGLIPIGANIKRTHSMAFLMLPTIIIYLAL